MKNSLLKFAAAAVAVGLAFGFTRINRETAVTESSLRQVLLDQLKSTHNQKDWFVPVNIAIEGLTPEQALWQDTGKIHSVGELTYHLIFWNERQLQKFNGQKEAAFSGNNEESFSGFDKKTWPETVKKLDKVLTDLEHVISTADESKLKEWSSTISKISTHNAYHTGEIIYVRKLQGSWNPEKGVK